MIYLEIGITPYRLILIKIELSNSISNEFINSISWKFGYFDNTKKLIKVRQDRHCTKRLLIEIIVSGYLRVIKAYYG